MNIGYHKFPSTDKTWGTGTNMKLYDKIKRLLENDPRLRDSDKLLIWRILELQGLTDYNSISKENFLRGINFESVRRARQLVQEDNPSLASSKNVQAIKDKKQKSLGTFVYRETFEVSPEEYRNNAARLVSMLEPVINKIKSSQSQLI